MLINVFLQFILFFCLDAKEPKTNSIESATFDITQASLVLRSLKRTFQDFVLLAQRNYTCRLKSPKLVSPIVETSDKEIS